MVEGLRCALVDPIQVIVSVASSLDPAAGRCLGPIERPTFRAAGLYRHPAPSTPSSPTPAPASPTALVHGTVKSGNIPLPGVAVTATNTLTGQKFATTTDINGAFSMSVPANGRYVLKTDLAAFAPLTKEALLKATEQRIAESAGRFLPGPGFARGGGE